MSGTNTVTVRLDRATLDALDRMPGVTRSDRMRSAIYAHETLGRIAEQVSRISARLDDLVAAQREGER